MKSAAILAILAGTASAFTSSSVNSASRTSLQAGMDDMVGAVDLRGKEFKFDPLKLSESYEPFLPWFREAELRHGRTAVSCAISSPNKFALDPSESHKRKSLVMLVSRNQD